MKTMIKNDLFDYLGLKIFQSVDAFKFSLDSILLAEYVRINKKTTSILDLCTGNCAIPLILSTKTDARMDAFEIQEDIYNLAVKSVEYNNLQDKITVYNDSITNIDSYLKHENYDIITCNPPYFKYTDGSIVNLKEAEAIARHEIYITLEEIFKIASSHLSDKGEFYLVHKSSRMDEIIIYANKYDLNVKNIQFIKTKENAMPSIVLVRCVKRSKLGVKINNVKNIQNLKTYQNMFKEE